MRLERGSIHFLHTRFSFNKAIFKTQYYSSKALGFKTAENDDLHSASRGWGSKMGKQNRETDQQRKINKPLAKPPSKPLPGPPYYRCRQHNGRLHRAFLHCTQGGPKTAEVNK